MCHNPLMFCKVDRRKKYTNAVADLKGVRETPHLAQNIFIFMKFSGKIGQIVGWRPPSGVSATVWEMLDPPLRQEMSIPHHSSLLCL